MVWSRFQKHKAFSSQTPCLEVKGFRGKSFGDKVFGSKARSSAAPRLLTVQQALRQNGAAHCPGVELERLLDGQSAVPHCCTRQTPLDC